MSTSTPIKPAAKSPAKSKARKAASHKTTTHIVPAPAPSREEIARLAEKYWAERGHPQGSPECDWIRAEQELVGKAS
ncbi:MAG TPA: DUF2934 domain-containing protein [Acidisarcina sp.]